jgi:Na+/H+-translocating membrane pyrophosphatase
VGTFFVRTRENASQTTLLGALRTGVYLSTALIAVLSFLPVRFTIGPAFLGVWGALIVGLVAGNVIGFFTEYYTSDGSAPIRFLSGESLTGPATVIIGGLALLAEYGNKIKEAVHQVFAEPASAEHFQAFYIGRNATGRIQSITLHADILDPRILIGLFLGGVLPLVFSSVSMRAVGRAVAQHTAEADVHGLDRVRAGGPDPERPHHPAHRLREGRPAVRPGLQRPGRRSSSRGNGLHCRREY